MFVATFETPEHHFRITTEHLPQRGDLVRRGRCCWRVEKLIWEITDMPPPGSKDTTGGAYLSEKVRVILFLAELQKFYTIVDVVQGMNVLEIMHAAAKMNRSTVTLQKNGDLYRGVCIIRGELHATDWVVSQKQAAYALLDMVSLEILIPSKMY